jgi:hypothetical protein
VAALESTLFYGIQAANHLSSCEVLTPFHTVVYGLNPKTIKNYKQSFIDLGKNDYVDARLSSPHPSYGSRPMKLGSRLTIHHAQKLAMPISGIT